MIGCCVLLADDVMQTHLSVPALSLSGQVPFLFRLLLLYVLPFSLLFLLLFLLSFRWGVDGGRSGLVGGCWSLFITEMLCLLFFLRPLQGTEQQAELL